MGLQPVVPSPWRSRGWPPSPTRSPMQPGCCGSWPTKAWTSASPATARGWRPGHGTWSTALDHMPGVSSIRHRNVITAMRTRLATFARRGVTDLDQRGAHLLTTH
jgi:hypothetical protein